MQLEGRGTSIVQGHISKEAWMYGFNAREK